MAGDVDISVDYAGERTTASRAASPAIPFGRGPSRAALRPQTPASPPRRFSAGGEGGRGAARSVRGYLDTPIGTSFRGTTEQGFSLERNRLRRKAVVAVWHSLNQCGREDEAKALIGCGTWFRVKRRPCGSYKLEGMPCDSVFCPDCANRRSKPLQRRVLSKMRREGKSYWHLTVTVKNEPALTREFLSRLIGQFSGLRESETWCSIRWKNGVDEEISGGVYSVEATRNVEKETWHPHLHVIIEAPRHLPRWWIFALQLAWFEITGESHVISLKPMYGLSKNGKRRLRRVNMRSVRELVKYATKSADFADSPVLVDEFLTAFKSVRRIQAFGSFLGVAEEPKEKGRQPGDESQLAGCACGRCTVNQWFYERKAVHISDTVLNADGSRQLAFDWWDELHGSMADDESPPGLVLVPEPLKTYEQARISFSGVLPVMSGAEAQLPMAV